MRNKVKVLAVLLLMLLSILLIGCPIRHTLKNITEDGSLLSNPVISVHFPEVLDDEVVLSARQTQVVYGRVAKGVRVGEWLHDDFYDSTGKHRVVKGNLFIVPAWSQIAVLKPLTLLFRNTMNVNYDPFYEVLVLRDMSIDPDMDFFVGVVVSNVSPEIIGLDLSRLKCKREAHGGDWKYQWRFDE